jgi:hypothetical protein
MLDEYKVMPKGLCNAPHFPDEHHFQAIFEKVYFGLF